MKPETQSGLCQLDQLPACELRKFAQRYGTDLNQTTRMLAAYALARACWREAIAKGDLAGRRQWAALADDCYFALPLEYRW